MNILSAFGGGLWIIIVILGGGAALAWLAAYRASKSGSKQWNDRLGKYELSDKNLPIWKCKGPFWFAVMLTLATIGSYIWMKMEA